MVGILCSKNPNECGEKNYWATFYSGLGGICRILIELIFKDISEWWYQSLSLHQQHAGKFSELDYEDIVAGLIKWSVSLWTYFQMSRYRVKERIGEINLEFRVVLVASLFAVTKYLKEEESLLKFTIIGSRAIPEAWTWGIWSHFIKFRKQSVMDAYAQLLFSF